MAITEKTSLYEILIRVRDDGSYGAHSQTITRILRDGEVISAIEGGVTELGEAGSDSYQVLQALIGETATDLLATNQVQTAQIRDLEQQLLELQPSQAAAQG